MWQTTLYAYFCFGRKSRHKKYGPQVSISLGERGFGLYFFQTCTRFV